MWRPSMYTSTLTSISNQRKNYIRRYVLLLQEALCLAEQILGSTPPQMASVKLETTEEIIANFDKPCEDVEEYFDAQNLIDWQRLVKLTRLAKPLHKALENLEVQLAVLNLWSARNETIGEHWDKNLAEFAMLVGLRSNPIKCIEKLVEAYQIPSRPLSPCAGMIEDREVKEGESRDADGKSVDLFASSYKLSVNNIH
jgi:hypothetical protein